MDTALGRWVDCYCQARRYGHGRCWAARWAFSIVWVLRR
jgi:hypothetical protein